MTDSMVTVIAFATWVSLLVPLYVYVGYPIVLFLLINVFRLGRDTRQSAIDASVTVIVSCYNEAPVIEEKIANCLSIDYSADKLEFVFVSDGSDDGTDELIKNAASARIRLVRQEGRLGKTSGLNLAMASIDSDIVVFSDANAMYQRDAIKNLVRHFSDDSVGYVVGAALYTDGDTSAAAGSENSYWNYEIAIKAMESKLHSVVGGDGAIYAIRRSLYEPLDQKDINDFVNPLQIIGKGYRGYFDREAVCYEETAGDFVKEGRRKQRIVNRSFRGLMTNAGVLNPFKTGFFSFSVISHKLLRWLVPVFSFVGFVGVLILSTFGSVFFQFLYACILLGFAAIIMGYAFSSREYQPRITQFAYYFYLVNYNALKGLLQYVGGETQVTWESSRAGGVADALREQQKTLLISACAWLFFAAYLYSLCVQ